MDNDVAIRVQKVSKLFKLPHEKNTSIKSMIVNFYRSQKGYELQKAVNNVSLEIKNGEFFGIIGRNGSGKSTLLKLLAGIYVPTSGNLEVNGSLTPFIELGVGFNQELTGRENVYLNGALLGFSRKEMEEMYQDIVEFAELERFMDQKLKNYSSGMQVRLAFSIAIRAKSDILLIDEVLAVGDLAFQEKCYRFFDQIKASNRTVVFISHDSSAVQRFCDRVAIVDSGKLIDVGEPKRMVLKYGAIIAADQYEAEEKTSKDNEHQGTGEVTITKVDVLDKHGKSSSSINFGEPFSVEASYFNTYFAEDGD
jgi:ABC-2 type transport system ATP-binding protein